MPKERAEWKRKLMREIIPVLELLGAFTDKEDLTGVRRQAGRLRHILEKARECEWCGDTYWHDDVSGINMCDDCEVAWSEEEARRVRQQEELERLEG